MILSKINSHPLDKEIVFQDVGHLYFIEGLKSKPISVTTLIHSFFSDFDADLIIHKMMASKNWTKSKYYGMTCEEIKKQWEDNRIESSSLGTSLHEKIEKFYNGELLPEEIPMTREFFYFLQFWNDFSKKNPEWKPYRTEWFVFDRELELAGSIDMTFSNSEGDIWIVDWKRSKEIKMTNTWDKAKPPLDHLDDCNFNHYSLQLNIYKYILEKNYNKNIIKMDLVVLHPNSQNYQTYSVDNLDEDIITIKNKRISDISYIKNS